MTAKGEPRQIRDEDWVRERFGDVGQPPSNEVHPDSNAPDQPVGDDPHRDGLAHPQ